MSGAFELRSSLRFIILVPRIRSRAPGTPLQTCVPWRSLSQPPDTCFLTQRAARPELKSHFQVTRTLQWCHKFMKMLSCELRWPRRDGKLPWGYVVMDCRRAQAHAISAAREGNKMGLWRLSLWLRTPRSCTCFVQGLGSELWSGGPSMIFTSLFLTSYDKQHHPAPLLCSPILWTFIFALPLNQALRQPHWNRHGPEEARPQTDYPLILVSLPHKTAVWP